MQKGLKGYDKIIELNPNTKMEIVRFRGKIKEDEILPSVRF